MKCGVDLSSFHQKDSSIKDEPINRNIKTGNNQSTIVSQKCHNCGVEIFENIEFCEDCGAKINVRSLTASNAGSDFKLCPTCKRQLPNDAEFCGSCGTTLTETSAFAPQIFIKEDEYQDKSALKLTSDVKHSLKPAFILFGIATLIVGLISVFFMFRTRTKIITNYQVEKYKTTQTSDPNLMQGLRYQKIVGKNGKRAIKIKIWTNRKGKEIKRRVVSSKIIIKPVSEVINVGAKTKKDVIIEVKNLLTQYLEARKSGDFAKVLSLSEPSSVEIGRASCRERV